MAKRDAFLLAICGRLIGCAAWLVPPSRRRDWIAEWRGELAHAFAKGPAPLSILRRCLGVFPDGVTVALVEWSSSLHPDGFVDSARRLVHAPAHSTLAVVAVGLAAGWVAAFATLAVRAATPATRMPYADQIVRVHNRPSSTDLRPFSGEEVALLRGSHGVFEKVGAYRWTFAGVDDPEGHRTRTLIALNPEALEVVGARLLVGAMPRLDGAPSVPRQAGSARQLTPAPVILAERFWRSSFQADPRVVGRTLSINGVEHPIAAVLADASGDQIGYADAFLPGLAAGLSEPVESAAAGAAPFRDLFVLARLKRGVTCDQARTSIVEILAPAEGADFYAEVLVEPAVKSGASAAGWALALAGFGTLLLVTSAPRATRDARRAVLLAAPAALVSALVAVPIGDAGAELLSLPGSPGVPLIAALLLPFAGLLLAGALGNGARRPGYAPGLGLAILVPVVFAVVFVGVRWTQLATRPLGVNEAGTTVVNVDASAIAPGQRGDWSQELARNLIRDGVASEVAVASAVPLHWGFRDQSVFLEEGAQSKCRRIDASYRCVGSNWLDSMGVERVGKTPGECTVVVNQAFAREVPSGVMGRRLLLGGTTEWVTVVGICADVVQRDLERDVVPEMFLSYAGASGLGLQIPGMLSLVLKGSGPDAGSTVARAVATDAAGASVGRTWTFAEARRESLVNLERAALLALLASTSALAGALLLFGQRRSNAMRRVAATPSTDSR